MPEIERTTAYKVNGKLFSSSQEAHREWVTANLAAIVENHFGYDHDEEDMRLTPVDIAKFVVVEQVRIRGILDKELSIGG